MQHKILQKLRISITLCAAMCFGAGISAQTSTDSLNIISKAWNKKNIKPGVTWYQGNFENLFASRQEVNFLKVDLRSSNTSIALAGVSDSLILTSNFAQQAGAVGAINATFFDMKNGGSVTFLRVDGEIINETTLLDKNGYPAERANGAILFGPHGVRILKRPPEAPSWEKELTATNVMVCGPFLLDNGLQVALDNNVFNNNRHPRSVVAINEKEELILMTIDGRNANAQGMSLHEAAFLLRVLGAKEALNLDGGGSTALYIQKEGTSGIVSYPSDNKLFDHAGERKVANAILVF